MMGSFSHFRLVVCSGVVCSVWSHTTCACVYLDMEMKEELSSTRLYGLYNINNVLLHYSHWWPTVTVLSHHLFPLPLVRCCPRSHSLRQSCCVGSPVIKLAFTSLTVCVCSRFGLQLCWSCIAWLSLAPVSPVPLWLQTSYNYMFAVATASKVKSCYSYTQRYLKSPR